jgi:citrate synthase
MADVTDSITITDNRSGESVDIPIDKGGVASKPWNDLMPGVWFNDPSFERPPADSK